MAYDDIARIQTDIGTLRVTYFDQRPQRGAVWVAGTLDEHYFQALVFPLHAERASYELGQSRISKLWVQRTFDGAIVVNFDRGWDVRPQYAQAVTVVERLSKHLAPLVHPIAWPPEIQAQPLTENQPLQHRRGR